MVQVGARVKVDSDEARKIIEAVGNANTLETAAAMGGVCARTVRNWLRRGSAAMHHFDITGEYPSKEEQKYAEWAREFHRAEGTIEAGILAAVKRSVAKGDGKLAMLLLEKRWPKRWGDGKLRQEIEALLDAVMDELGDEAYERVLARIGGEATGANPSVTAH